MRPVTSHDLARGLQVELARSRRHGRPFSVAVLVPAPPPGHRGDARGRLGWGRSSGGADGLARLVSPHLRTFDIVASNGSHAVVLAPETDDAGASAMVDRLVAVASRKGIALRTGTATFPDDAQRPDDLLAFATRRSTGVAASMGAPRP